jgi:RNA polymerase sigma-70 factor (ECF subfamily)
VTSVLPAVRTEPSDSVRRALAGDLAAFEDVYREHVGRVYALCLRMSGDAALADDLTQEVFVRAWEALPTWRGESALSTWLHRIAVNVLLGDRRATVRRLARVEPVADADGPGADHAAGAGLDLDRALATLPEKARQVFVLHEVEGLGHDQIAHAMGTSVGTAKSQLHRARELLRRFLS